MLCNNINILIMDKINSGLLKQFFTETLSNFKKLHFNDKLFNIFDTLNNIYILNLVLPTFTYLCIIFVLVNLYNKIIAKINKTENNNLLNKIINDSKLNAINTDIYAINKKLDIIINNTYRTSDTNHRNEY
jgi:hypothetical protein